MDSLMSAFVAASIGQMRPGGQGICIER
jgi:hypothetical protein